MKILRQKTYSQSNFVKKISDKLDNDKYLDYEVSDRIPKDSLGISADLNHLEIYIPESMEFDQYYIDDYIRENIPFSRTTVRFDRNIYVMTISRKLTEAQYIKLIKYFINEYEFCVIVDNH